MDSKEQANEPDFFKSDVQSVEQKVDSSRVEATSVSWSASEFLQHEKSIIWYLSAVAAIGLFALVLYVLTKDAIGPFSVVVLGAILLVAAGRKPRTVQYTVDPNGIVVGNREYDFDDFQSFTIVKDDQLECIALFPQKRFAPEINMYFSPEDGQKIFDILSEFLPFEQREKDRIDKFLHKIKF